MGRKKRHRLPRSGSGSVERAEKCASDVWVIACIASVPGPYYNELSKEYGGSVMSDSTLTSKGQTTIPKDIRDSLGIKPGSRMTFTLMPDGTVLMRVKNKSVMSLAGSLRKKGQKALPINLLSR